MTKTENISRTEKYRIEVRKTFQSMSDQALSFQDMRISQNDCIDRQEINREINRRRYGR